METATKDAQGPRSTDHVLEALATLAALLDRTINEVKAVDSDFQNRLLQAVHNTESSIQAQAAEHLDAALCDLRRTLQEEHERKVAGLTANWNAERQRLDHEVERVAQAGLQWEEQRARLNSEIEEARNTAVEAVAPAESYKTRAEAEMAKAAAAAPTHPGVPSAGLLQEVERAEAAIKQISALIDDHTTELSIVIRKNVERAELEAYLKGIRFAITSGKT